MTTPITGASKLTKFAVFTIIVLALVGGLRLARNLNSIGETLVSSEGNRPARAVEACEKFMGEGDTPAPDIVPEGQSRCETWIELDQQLAEDYAVWHFAILAAEALIAAATLLVGWLVFRRRTNAKTVMTRLFMVQLLVTVGEVILASWRHSRVGDLLLQLWPALPNDGVGWVLLHGEMLGAVIPAVLGCVLYLGLMLMVRSKRLATE